LKPAELPAQTSAGAAPTRHKPRNTSAGRKVLLLGRNRTLCRRLGIPADHSPALALIVGYPATRFRRAVRRRFTQTNIVR